MGSACLTLAIALAGCGLWQSNVADERLGRAQKTEPLLTAAGFRTRPADSAERMSNLQSLAPLSLRTFTKDGQTRYYFADPYYCRCVLVGDQAAYQRYRQLKAEMQQTEQEEVSAAITQEAISEDAGLPQLNGFDSVWSP